MEAEFPRNDFIPGLNGIRALSALLVISTHWPGNMLSLKFGWIGVNIFFVLSGFLITRILLVEKQKPFGGYLRTFYYKRSLRIFPVYYLFLAGITVLLLLVSGLVPRLATDEIWKGGLRAVQHDLPFLATYTYNLKLNLRYFLDYPDSSNQFFGHLWSLAVEEQFYLVFPFVVYFASPRSLKGMLIGLLVLCPLIRLWAAVDGVQRVTDHYWLGETLYTNPLCQADALAAGAALAVFRFRVSRPYRFFFGVFTLWLAVGMAVFFSLRQAGYFLVEGKSFGYNFPGFWFDQPTPWWWINIRAAYQYSLVNLLAVALVLPAIVKKPLFPALFTHPWAEYLGKISYGIYLFHNPMIALMEVLLGYFGAGSLLVHPVQQVVLFAVYLAAVLGLAHLSYRYFEQRFLSFKVRLALSS